MYNSVYTINADIESAAMANVKQWVIDNTGDLSMKANINSPSFTGTPTSTTPTTTDKCYYRRFMVSTANEELTGLANSIRTKTNTTDKMTIVEMTEAVENLSIGGDNSDLDLYPSLREKVIDDIDLRGLHVQ